MTRKTNCYMAKGAFVCEGFAGCAVWVESSKATGEQWCLFFYDNRCTSVAAKKEAAQEAVRLGQDYLISLANGKGAVVCNTCAKDL